MVTPEYNKSRTCNDKRSLCHAPSYSMHFAKNGLVSACSFTRFMPQGKYPDQTIDEIWFGAEASRIRKDMRGSTFPAGCAVCASDAYAGNFGQMRSKLYEQYALSPIKKTIAQLKNGIQTGKFREYPRVISFELSNTCNLECVMCVGLLSSSIRKNRDKLPPLPDVYDKQFVQQLRPYIPHLDEAKFFGGEPFLIDLYLDVWELFVELNPNCKIYITSNGTILNNRVKNILEKLPNFQLVISLDAINKMTYEKIRINANHEKVMENLMYFKSVSEKHNRNLIISPTYMIHNWEEYPSILDFATSNNILFETNILTTPRELSLANFSPTDLETVKDKWKNHLPYNDNSNTVYSRNIAEFNKALSQVEFMLEEQKAFYNHPTGTNLLRFKPTNKMESCLLIMYMHSIKTTRDPSLPLRLLEVWAENKNLLNYFLDSVYSFGNTSLLFTTTNPSSFMEELKETIKGEWSDQDITTGIKQILNDEKELINFLEACFAGNQQGCLDIFNSKVSSNFKIPVDSDFF